MRDRSVLAIGPCSTRHENPVDTIYEINHRIFAGLFVESERENIFLVSGQAIIHLCSGLRKKTE